MYSEQSLWEIERDFIYVIGRMEQGGLCVDTELAQSEIERGELRMEKIVDELSGLKPSGTQALEELLLKRLGLPLVKPTKGTKDLPRNEWKPSFDKEAMEEYDQMLAEVNDPTAQLVLEYRGWQKSISTFYKAFRDKLCSDGRLRPSFFLQRTVTGRLSCADPNCQQIPKSGKKDWNKNCKACISSPEGFEGWEIDYSQLELRMAAQLAQDDELIETLNAREADIFDYMTSRLTGWHRDMTKTNTYLTLFGGQDLRRSIALGISMEEARERGKEFRQAFPKLLWIADQCEQIARRDKYIQYWSGRRRHLPFGGEARKAFNAWCQGGGFDIVKRAIISCFKEVCDENCVLNLTVHDSLRFDIRNGMADRYIPQLCEIMERPPSEEFKVRFYVDAKRWG